MDDFDVSGSISPKWTLHLPNGEARILNGYPQTLREVALLGMQFCDRVDAAMRDSVTSIADPAALCAALPLRGVSEAGLVSMSSDGDLRRYFRAAGKMPTLRLMISSEACTETEPVLSPRSFVALREHAKAQESVQLNVGGTMREIHRLTAERIPLLAAMLRFPRATSTPLFLDASPQAFDVLLEVARGRSSAYLDSLEPSMRILAQEYAEYAGMDDIIASGRYSFHLTTTNPTNKSAVNTSAFLMHQGAACTTGVRPTWNTVVGDVPVPQTGQSYWEVEVTSLGTAGREFMVGVVASSFTNLGSFLDSSNAGWGIYHNSAGAVFLRANGANQGNSYAEAFPIDTGTRIGVLVDADRGSLLFFRNGIFKMSHMTTIKGQALLPALSINTDATLSIRTGLPVPV
mmetsp:Transcript_56690/g.165884  ORF Transcript_56690/g.165884 Transcript_56690/m.165884 type:complete len:403 (-) Transcript_56690:190-1398(-)